MILALSTLITVTSFFQKTVEAACQFRTGSRCCLDSCNSGDDSGQRNHFLRHIFMSLDTKLFEPQYIDFPSITVIDLFANRHYVG